MVAAMKNLLGAVILGFVLAGCQAVGETLSRPPAAVDTVTDCDYAAADPFDRGRVVGGRAIAAIDAVHAIKVCTREVQGHPGTWRFEYQLARAYEAKGDGVQALEWYGRAANHGHPAAQLMIGQLFLEGRWVERDARQAVPWLMHGVRANYAPAQYLLAQAYLRGDGVTPNLREALSLLNAAANQNFPPAMFSLGKLYETGTGVYRNRNTALYWYQQADHGGHEEAKEAVRRIQPR